MSDNNPTIPQPDPRYQPLIDAALEISLELHQFVRPKRVRDYLNSIQQMKRLAIRLEAGIAQATGMSYLDAVGRYEATLSRESYERSLGG